MNSENIGLMNITEFGFCENEWSQMIIVNDRSHEQLNVKIAWISSLRFKQIF